MLLILSIELGSLLILKTQRQLTNQGINLLKYLKDINLYIEWMRQCSTAIGQKEEIKITALCIIGKLYKVKQSQCAFSAIQLSEFLHQ